MEMINEPGTFLPFPSIPRGKAMECTITEKIDGSNVAVHINENGHWVGAQSRKRMLYETKAGDLNGFFKWCDHHHSELADILGPGIHFGEWAGPGIRKNPMNLEEKRFFLFNTFKELPEDSIVVHPRILFRGSYYEGAIQNAMDELREWGHFYGYKPEGVVIYYHWLRAYQKETFAHPDGKWTANVG